MRAGTSGLWGLICALLFIPKADYPPTWQPTRRSKPLILRPGVKLGGFRGLIIRGLYKALSMCIDNLDRFLIQGCRLPLCNILYQLLSLIYLDSPRWPHISHLPKVVVLFPLFHLHTIFLFFYKNPPVSTFFDLLSTERAILPAGGTGGILWRAVTLETTFGIS